MSIGVAVCVVHLPGIYGIQTMTSDFQVEKFVFIARRWRTTSRTRVSGFLRTRHFCNFSRLSSRHARGNGSSKILCTTPFSYDIGII